MKVVPTRFGKAELKTVDDAAKVLEQSRSFFVSRAAIERAQRVLADAVQREHSGTAA